MKQVMFRLVSECFEDNCYETESNLKCNTVSQLQHCIHIEKYCQNTVNIIHANCKII